MCDGMGVGVFEGVFQKGRAREFRRLKVFSLSLSNSELEKKTRTECRMQSHGSLDTVFTF